MTARRLTLYRDDSTVQVVYERVKTAFWTAGNTVLVIAQYTGDGPEHRYIHWPRERFCWFKAEPRAQEQTGREAKILEAQKSVICAASIVAATGNGLNDLKNALIDLSEAETLGGYGEIRPDPKAEP